MPNVAQPKRANNVDVAQASRAERFMLGAAKEQGMVGQHARLFADQKSFTFRESVASLGKGFTDDLWESLPDTQALGQSIGSGVYNAVHNPTQTLNDLGSAVKSKLAYLKVLHDNPLGVLLYLKAVEKQKIETFKHDMSDAVTKVKAGDLSPIGRMGAEVFKLVALGGVAKVAPALKGVGLFARGANVERTVVATGGESVAKTVRFRELASGTRADVRALLKSGTLDLPAEQIDKILYNLGSGRMDKVTLKLMNTGDGRIVAERAGRTSGYQRMSFEVDQVGRTNKVVQTAFDDANKLVPQKPGQSKNNLYDVKKWNKNSY